MYSENEFEKIASLEITTPKKSKKPFMQYIFIALLSLSSGFVGGYMANEINPKEVIYETKSIVEHTAVNDGNMSIQNVVYNVQDSVVEIKVVISATGFLGQQIVRDTAGSGVIITSDGYVVTNNHVIENASEINVILRNGNSYKADLIGNDKKSDLAVLKIEGKDFVSATFGDSSEILVGDTAIAIGNPLGELGGSVTSGIISALDREINIDNQPMNLLQTNAEINPGNSGGGLFNTKAQLIGIVNAKTKAVSVEGIGFAIPINDVKKIVEELIDNGYVSNRATLGIYTEEIFTQFQDFEPGLYVKKVMENSGASEAGILAGDRIIEIDGQEVSSYIDLSRILKKHNPGDTVKITIVRNDENITFEVKLTKAIMDNNKK